MDPLTEPTADAIRDPQPAARERSILGLVSGFPVIGPLCLALLVCGFCWKLTLTSQYTWIDNPDITRMDVPRLQFQRAAWHDHEFPLWDPHLWCGQPFLGEIVGAAFPLNWPFLRLPRGSVGLFSFEALNWYFVYLHLIGALAAYWLCRELKLGVTASILGGFVYSFGGFTGATLWPEVLSSVVVAPLVFVFLVRALRGKREFSSAALSGMFLGLAWLSGHHEVPIYLSLTVGAVWLYGFAWRRDWQRWLVLGCLSLIITILVSGFQTVPGYEYAKLALRWVGDGDPLEWNQPVPYRVDAQYSMIPSSLMSLIVPWSATYSEGYTGVVALALAVIAVIRLWHERWVRLFACIALGGLLLALGSWNPLHGFLYSVLPLFDKARTPTRALSIVQIGVAVLAAAGVNSLRSTTPEVFRGAARTLMVWGAGVFALGIAVTQLHLPAMSEYIYLSGLIAILLACLFLARYRGAVSSRIVPIALLTLTFIELASGGARLFTERTPAQPSKFLPELSRYHDVANFLRGQPGPVRVYAMEVTDSFNLGDWEGIDTLTGFGAGITTDLARLDWASVRGQNLLGVGYTLSKATAPRPDQTLVLHSSAGFNLFKNNDAFPRTWIVHRMEPAASVEQLRARLNDPGFDARHAALLVGRIPELESCEGPEDARISRRKANSVFVEARLACRGMLVLSDTWYPGWSAQVDGRTAPIYPADSALRGVVIGPGQHHIEFRYRPASAIIGAAMSVSGLLGAVMIVFWERRRARR